MGSDGGNESASDANQCMEEESSSDLEEKKSEWNLKVCTVVGPSGASDSIGALAFDAKEHQWLATGGIARKIRLYDFNNLIDLQQSCSLEDEEDDLMDIDGGNDVMYVEQSSSIEASVICTSAKLSSLKWEPSSGDEVIGSGDYDGVVTEWDVERGVALFERDEHGGRRVWSVDYSQWSTSLCASASDDGTVQMWDRKSNQTFKVITTPSKSPVCCVEFSGDSKLDKNESRNKNAE